MSRTLAFSSALVLLAAAVVVLPQNCDGITDMAVYPPPLHLGDVFMHSGAVPQPPPVCAPSAQLISPPQICLYVAWTLMVATVQALHRPFLEAPTLSMRQEMHFKTWYRLSLQHTTPSCQAMPPDGPQANIPSPQLNSSSWGHGTPEPPSPGINKPSYLAGKV
jgi:hypothetical protein